MAKQTWTVTGRIMFRPQFSETRSEYGDLVALPGVRVQVSAKESKLDPTWDEWGDVYAGPQGRFSFTINKDKTPRYFRVRVMFKDDGLKIYAPSDGILSKLSEAVTGINIVNDLVEDALEIALAQTTRLTFDVKWLTAVQHGDKSQRKGPGHVDFDELVFEQGGEFDLGDRTARRHADIWWLAKRMSAKLDEIGCGFFEKRPPAFIHPFKSPLIGDAVESSYTNPQTDVIHLLENARSDHFNAASVAHEFMHALMFQYSTGEKGLAWQLLLHGSTHDGRQSKRWVACHEGFAEWAGNLLYSHIYNRPATIYGDKDSATGQVLDNRARPFSRRFLRDQGIRSLSELDYFEYGWIALFTALVSRDLDRLDPDTAETWAKYPGQSMWSAGQLRGTSDTPGLADLIGAFKAAASKGYPKLISLDEMTRVTYLQRLMATSPIMSAARRDLVNDLLDTAKERSVPAKPPQKPKPEPQTAP